MQIKSWQIALVGSLPFFGLLGFMVVLQWDNMFIFIGLVPVILILLLKSTSTRIKLIGGLISIIFGFIVCLYFLFFLVSLGGELVWEDFSFFAYPPMISALAFLVAGIYYFWKKN